MEQLGSTKLAPYEYRPLDRSRQEIRLLTIEPGSGSDMVRCTLKHAFLDTTPPPHYETTSYVCGDPAIKSTIILHGHETQAMATSETVLRRMRLRDRARTVWIDSICIDQNDTDERGHQVGMMYQVYTKTRRNLIWLGPGDDTLAESIEAMETILREVAIETRDFADFDELVIDRESGAARFSNTPLSNPEDYLDFLRLLESPWFSRLWIVQEASLAPSSECHYGEFIVPLTGILRSARWLYYKWYQLPEIPKSASLSIENAVSIFHSADRELGYFTPDAEAAAATMALYLRQFWGLQTFDRRDRVFAILGLWQMVTKTPVLPDSLRPDYNLSVGEVFSIGIRYAIEESGGLWPLESISEPPQNPEDALWPSWVPVIDADPWGKEEPFRLRGGHFEVDNDTALITERDSDRPSDLIVSGVLFDTVVEVTPAVTLGMTFGDIYTLLEDLERPRCESRAGTLVGDLETQISLVLLGGTIRDARMAHQEALQGYRSFKAYLKEVVAVPRRPRDRASGVSDDYTLVGDYQSSLLRNSRYRAVFHTTTGHMGLGPRCTQPGDVVAIPYGSNLPMVMRPLPEQAELPKGRYMLLGASYVYGIMDGEAVRKHKETRMEDDVFRIV